MYKYTIKLIFMFSSKLYTFLQVYLFIIKKIMLYTARFGVCMCVCVHNVCVCVCQKLI